MRIIGKLVLAVGVAAISASPAWAQGRGGGMMGMGGGAALLANEGVQKEIKATEEQASRLTTIADEMMAKNREAFADLRDLGQEERQEKMAALNKATSEEVAKAVKEVLKPEQAKRFHQIELQQAGVNAFMTPRVVEALKLTEAQKGKMGEVVESSRAAMMEAFRGGGGGGDREAMMAKMRELRKESLDKAVAALDDDQKKAWKELHGDPFEVQFQRRQPN